MIGPVEVAHGGRRIWTLLEIKRQFSTADFTEIYGTSGFYNGFRMLRRSRVWSLFDILARREDRWYNTKVVVAKDRTEFSAEYQRWGAECAALGLNATAATLQKMRRPLALLWQLGIRRRGGPPAAVRAARW